MTWHYPLALAVASAGLVACDSSPVSQLPLALAASAAQKACIAEVSSKQRGAQGQFEVAHRQARNDASQNIQITLAERRSNENLCLKEAACYSAPAFSAALFTACLQRLEKTSSAVFDAEER